MKHSLLIILSFLLLSSPVIGHPKGEHTFYDWSECWEFVSCDYKWMGFGDKETQPVYKGQVKDGKPDGLGFLIYPDGSRYIGSWKKGERNGRGTQTHPNGNKFVGEYKENKRWNGTEYKNGDIVGKKVNGRYSYIKQ